MTTEVRRLPVRRSEIRLTDEESRSVLIDTDSGATHVLNPTARAIWELCDGNTTLDELVDAICQVFSVPHSVAERDVAEALARLEEVGLVAWTSDRAEPR